MAQYKVIQDIEAEDKLLGPLTLKQFIYAAITIILVFVAYKLAAISPYIVILFLPEILFFGLLAAPFGIDQPNEIWLLAKIRFFLKPQIRKWNQDGIGSLVTVTVPKKIDKKLTKDFTATEAKSRLTSLAKTLDTGGWSTSNSSPRLVIANLNGFSDDDRLVDLSTMTPNQPVSDAIDQDDIFDDGNLQAQHINSVITENERRIKDYQKNLVSPADNSDSPINRSNPSNYRLAKDYMKVAPEQPAFRPIESRFNPKATIDISPTTMTSSADTQSSVTSHPDNAKINILARDSNRNIASIERELNGGDDSGEVIISLH